MSKVLQTTRKWGGGKLAASLLAVCSAFSLASFADSLMLTGNGGASGHETPQNGDTQEHVEFNIMGIDLFAEMLKA